MRLRTRRFVRRLFEVLFICKSEADNNEFEIQVQLTKLQKQLQLLLYPVLLSDAFSNEQAAVFFDAVPQLYKKLLLDAKALYEADPAAKNIDEVLVAYPRFFCNSHPPHSASAAAAKNSAATPHHQRICT